MGETPSVLSLTTTGESFEETLVDKIITPADFELDYPFHVEPLIPRHTTMFLGAPQGAKSLTSIFLSVCTAGNKDFLGYLTRPGSVGYVNNEHGTESFLDRWIEKFCLGLGLSYNTLPLTSFSYQYKDFTSTSQTKELLSKCKQLGVILLIVDNLGSSIGGNNENYTQTMQQVFNNFLLLTEAGIAVVVVHHPNKSGVTRGSTVIDAMADSIYTFERVSTRPRVSLLPSGEVFVEEVMEYYAVSNTKTRSGGYIPPFLIRIMENDETGAARLVSAGAYSKITPVDTAKKAIQRYYELNPGQGFAFKDIVEGTSGRSEQKVLQEAFSLLISETWLEERPSGKRLRVFQAGVESEPVQAPQSVGAQIEETVVNLLHQYKEAGKVKLYLADSFSSVILEGYPELTGVTNLAGMSHRVSKLLVTLGLTTKKDSHGAYILL